MSHLDNGAIAFCFLREWELIVIGWAAITDEAKKSLTKIPLHTYFPGDSAFLGGGWTNPRHRDRGYWSYGYFSVLNYLHAAGVNTAYLTVNTHNYIMRRAISKFASPYAKGYYLKILWFRYWKQKEIYEGNHTE
jgi:hypothetical protein